MVHIASDCVIFAPLFRKYTNRSIWKITIAARTETTMQTVVETIVMTNGNDESGSSSSGVTACPAANRRQSQTTLLQTQRKISK